MNQKIIIIASIINLVITILVMGNVIFIKENFHNNPICSLSDGVHYKWFSEKDSDIEGWQIVGTLLMKK